MVPEDCWKPFEGTARSFAEASKLILKITEEDTDRLFAWRGVPDAAWALHSSLYRRLLWTRDPSDGAPTEDDLADAENHVISEAQAWGLHSGDRGRLSMFEFLATLQHYGAPTRFIDVTYNPFASLFFATEKGRHDSEDGRVFAVEVTGRLVNGHKDSRLASWEQMNRLPWTVNTVSDKKVWLHSSYIWKPTGFDRRISAQHGAFLFGGVPTTGSGAWPKTTSPRGGKWRIDEVRRATSVSVRPYVIDRSVGRPPLKGAAVYSFRITSSAKEEIRNVLKRTYGLTHATIYPDFPGFASFGVGDWLKNSP